MVVVYCTIRIRLTLKGYHSWRRLGDVISSLFTLGYHERIFENSSVPPFIKDLRRTAFARAYSADKNVSIFLGRPPRLLKRYCRFHLPGHEQEFGAEHSAEPFVWKASDKFDYTTDTRWSAICAMLKDEVLDLVQAGKYSDRTERATQVEV